MSGLAEHLNPEEVDGPRPRGSSLTELYGPGQGQRKELFAGFDGDDGEVSFR